MYRSPFAAGTFLATLLVAMPLAGALSGCGASAPDELSRAESLSSADPTERDPIGATDGSAGPTDAGADASTSSDASTGAVVEVLVKRASFAPADVTIHPGDTVRWVWSSGRHNVVSGTVAGDQGTPDGKFCSPGAASCDSAPLHGPPYTYEHVFTEAGDYPYYCTPHISMGMIATVHVVP